MSNPNIVYELARLTLWLANEDQIELVKTASAAANRIVQLEKALREIYDLQWSCATSGYNAAVIAQGIARDTLGVRK